MIQSDEVKEIYKKAIINFPELFRNSLVVTEENRRNLPWQLMPAKEPNYVTPG
jgi:hypothetical protein